MSTSTPSSSWRLLDTFWGWLQGQESPSESSTDTSTAGVTSLDQSAVQGDEHRSIARAQLNYLSKPLDASVSPSDNLHQLRSEIDALLEARRADARRPTVTNS